MAGFSRFSASWLDWARERRVPGVREWKWYKVFVTQVYSELMSSPVVCDNTIVYSFPVCRMSIEDTVQQALVRCRKHLQGIVNDQLASLTAADAIVYRMAPASECNMVIEGGIATFSGPLEAMRIQLRRGTSNSVSVVGDVEDKNELGAKVENALGFAFNES